MYGRRSAEGEALRVLEKIDSSSPHLAEVMSGWDWLFDNDMSWHERHVAEYMALLDERLPAFLPPMIALPWIRDGIDESEAEAVEILYREALCYDLEFAIEQATAPWVVDGLSAAEQQRLPHTAWDRARVATVDPCPGSDVLGARRPHHSDERDALWSLMGISSRGRQDDAMQCSTHSKCPSSTILLTLTRRCHIEVIRIVAPFGGPELPGASSVPPHAERWHYRLPQKPAVCNRLGLSAVIQDII